MPMTAAMEIVEVPAAMEIQVLLVAKVTAVLLEVMEIVEVLVDRETQVLLEDRAMVVQVVQPARTAPVIPVLAEAVLPIAAAILLLLFFQYLAAWILSRLITTPSLPIKQE